MVLWLPFALIYLLVPNTKVHFGAALIGGMVGGSLWHLNNVFGFLYVSRVVTNGQIYGSLGLVPVFMVGLVFFVGDFAVRRAIRLRLSEPQGVFAGPARENVNQRGREFVALRLMTCIGQRFQHGLPPVTSSRFPLELAFPAGWCNRFCGR